MGFLDKLAKSFGGKKEEVARPASNRPYHSSQRITPPRTKPVPVPPPNGDHGTVEKTASSSVPASLALPETKVAIADQPEVQKTVTTSQAPPISLTEEAKVSLPEETNVSLPEDAKVLLAEEQEVSQPQEPKIFDVPATQAAASTELTGENLFSDNFDQDLDDAFDSLVSQESTPESPAGPSAEMSSSDQAVIAGLFADIAANYARPVKNFIFELKRGTATKEWIEICRPAMQGIRRSAEGMGLTVAAQRMIDVETALSMAQGSEQRVLGGEIRDLLLTCYEDLIKVMPQAFVVGEEEQQREGIIINALLMQIPKMGHVTIDKLFRAGLTTLDALFLAHKADLAVATGIPLPMSQLICEKFQEYRSELEGNSRELGVSSQRARLTDMLAELRRYHESFELATENEWSNPALATEKRDYRQQRQSCSLRINVLLAEMGELDLVNELQKFSFDRRIQRLEEFLASPSAAA